MFFEGGARLKPEAYFFWDFFGLRFWIFFGISCFIVLSPFFAFVFFVFFCFFCLFAFFACLLLCFFAF
jgi:hypothetical protein